MRAPEVLRASIPASKLVRDSGHAHDGSFAPSFNCRGGVKTEVCGIRAPERFPTHVAARHEWGTRPLSKGGFVGVDWHA